MPRSREATMQTDVQQELLRLLRRLMQEEEAKRYFNEPVDSDLLGIPEYRQIIKEPMDLGKVFWKLKDDTYKDMSSFFADLHLVLSYQRLENKRAAATVAVYVASEKLCRSFGTWWNRSRHQLHLNEEHSAFPYEAIDVPRDPLFIAKVSPSRNRRAVTIPTKPSEETDSTGAAQLHATQARPITASKFRIKLGRVSTKRGHSSKNKSGSLFGKGKEKILDADTAKRLDTCISILERILQCPHGMTLSQTALQATFVPSLSDICQGLIEAKGRGWARCPYSSSRDVLREASLYLSSQSVKNEHRKKIVSTCQGLMKGLEKMWNDMGFGEDVESLKAISEELEDETRRHDSKLRVTKARMEKQKRQEMEKEVKEAEQAIAQLEKAKTDVEQAKFKLDKAKESLKEASATWHSSYRTKLTQLAELSKEKGAALKQKEKALAAIKASQVAVECLREKDAALEILKEKERRVVSAIETEHSKLEVLPKDAVLADIRHYAKKQKTTVDMSAEHLVPLGQYWLSK